MTALFCRLGESVVRQVSFTLLLNLIVAIVILLSTRGTAGSDIWFMCLADKPMVRGYHLTDYDWTPLSQNPARICYDTLSATAVGRHGYTATDPPVKRGASSVVEPQNSVIVRCSEEWARGPVRYWPHATWWYQIIRRRPSFRSGCRT